MSAPSITISSDALEPLRADLDGRLLRIAFTTGCGGSGYRLASAAEPNEGDVVLEVESISIALDELASSQLDGAVIVWDPQEQGYGLEHPNAVTAVWCG
ncbi:MAG TPA: iron-sulfur cluster biosynthesis family protein [Thermoanaerobaculia bacterium]|nr:iron-sulfur cluster biosynthesis family protein [Thermoanaerobaculia bacterium]